LALCSHRCHFDNPSLIWFAAQLPWTSSKRHQTQRAKLAVLCARGHLHPNVLFIFSVFPTTWTSALKTIAASSAAWAKYPSCKRRRTVSRLHRRVRGPVITSPHLILSWIRDLPYFGLTAINKHRHHRDLGLVKEAAFAVQVARVARAGCVLPVSAAGAVLLACCSSPRARRSGCLCCSHLRRSCHPCRHPWSRSCIPCSTHRMRGSPTAPSPALLSRWMPSLHARPFAPAVVAAA
jgi:hypothetical protein